MVAIQHRIRWVMRKDLTKIVEISQQHCLKSEDDFKQMFSGRDVIGKVMEIDDKIIGYIIYKVRPRDFEILDLAIVEEYKRNGLATEFISHLANRLKSPRGNILCRVRDTNLPMHMMLKKNDFKAVMLVRGLYGKNDGYTFVRQDLDHKTMDV